jgi:hypothetical protein
MRRAQPRKAAETGIREWGPVGAPPSPHRNDLTEQLMLVDGQVRLAMRVPFGHEQATPVRAHARADDAVSEEAVCNGEQDDVADSDALERPALYDQHVPRPERRQHARAMDADSRRAEASQGFDDEGGSGGRQEFFLTDLHGPLEGLIFPHASAMVSNTCSRMKAGFWYGFLPASCTGAWDGS